MTPRGMARLRKELEHLKSVVRPSISQAIAEARKHGDLKENAEYHAAKEQQGFSEGRILEIEGKLAEAQVIDVSQLTETGKVIFGCTVTLLNLENNQEVRYEIVGEDEADIKDSKISIMSPIARALIGRAIGDPVVVKTPDGDKEYEVQQVEHL